MLSLNTNLSSIGISAATGIDLVTKREELDATLPQGKSTASETDTRSSDTSKQAKTTTRELTAEQQQEVQELKRIDAKVRAHEQAHLAVGRSIVTSGPDYTYTYGPDGKPYATAGEVGIDTSAEKKPEQNIDKGVLIQRTALAPAEPSPQDFRAAAAGAQLESRGYSDLAREQAQEQALQAQEARQQREAQAADAGNSSAESSLADTDRAAANANDTRLLVQNAYATATGSPADKGRVSVFA